MGVSPASTQAAPARERTGAGVLKKPHDYGRDAFSFAAWT